MHPALPNPESPGDRPPDSGQPLCPVCRGLLIEQRGWFRCTRCPFRICEGCEGGEAESVLGLGG
jgi:hypothetical protein